MYSSVKFFAPTRTVVARCDAWAVLPISSATPNATANAAFAARLVCLRNTESPFPGWRPAGTLCTETVATRDEFARQAEQGAEPDRERGDPQRRRDDAAEAIARLVEDDVPEP